MDKSDDLLPPAGLEGVRYLAELAWLADELGDEEAHRLFDAWREELEHEAWIRSVRQGACRAAQTARAYVEHGRSDQARVCMEGARKWLAAAERRRAEGPGGAW